MNRFSFEHLQSLYDYDSKLSLDLEDVIIEKENDIALHDIEFNSPKGGRVTAFLVTPVEEGKNAGIVFGHWGYGTRTEFLPEAKLYAKAGAVSILVDYPWVRPSPWRKALSYQPDEDRRIFIQAVVDFRRSIDFLCTLESVDVNRIAYVGHSHGAQWGAILAAIDRRIKTAVLIGGVPAQADIYLESDDPDIVRFRNSMPKENLEKYLETTEVVDAIHYIGNVAPTPILFQFAKYERYFGEKSMRRYFEAASEPKSVKWYSTGHELNDIQTLLDRADWLQRHVGIRPIDFANCLQRRLH